MRTSELLRRKRQFDTAFAEFAALVVPDPFQANIGGVPRKADGEFHFCSDLQHRGSSDQCRQHSDNPGVRGLLQAPR